MSELALEDRVRSTFAAIGRTVPDSPPTTWTEAKESRAADAGSVTKHIRPTVEGIAAQRGLHGHHQTVHAAAQIHRRHRQPPSTGAQHASARTSAAAQTTSIPAGRLSRSPPA